jgi:hypothetical protein
MWYPGLSTRIRRKKWPYRYARPHNILRYSFWALQFFFLFLAAYWFSIFLTRTVILAGSSAYFVKPVLAGVNNWLSPVLTSRGIYSVFPVSIPAIRWEILVFPYRCWPWFFGFHTATAGFIAIPFVLSEPFLAMFPGFPFSGYILMRTHAPDAAVVTGYANHPA